MADQAAAVRPEHHQIDLLAGNHAQHFVDRRADDRANGHAIGGQSALGRELRELLPRRLLRSRRGCRSSAAWRAPCPTDTRTARVRRAAETVCCGIHRANVVASVNAARAGSLKSVGTRMCCIGIMTEPPDFLYARRVPSAPAWRAPSLARSLNTHGRPRWHFRKSQRGAGRSLRRTADYFPRPGRICPRRYCVRHHRSRETRWGSLGVPHMKRVLLAVGLVTIATIAFSNNRSHARRRRPAIRSKA
jgi:hypothetical protein